jgi:L-threonylcarbamoyladenylate synthase
MRRLVSDPERPDETAIAEAVDVLRRGGIVAYPTDTLYGLAVDPTSDAAVRKLFGLKGRDAAAAIALIAAEPAQAEHAGRFGAIERRLGASFWPGPLTIVVPAAEAMSQLLAPRGTLGVRVPDHPVARELARRFGECITATSANPSGAAAPASAAGVVRAFSEGVDLLLDAGVSRGGAPSTIVEVVDGRLTLHRAGAIAWNRVLESVQ